MAGLIHGVEQNNFMFPSHMNYGRYFIENIIKFGDKIALIDAATDEQITYAELVQRILNTAAAISRLGIGHEAVVAICSENRIEYMITELAVLYNGGVATFFNPAYSKSELVNAVNISRPRYLFLSPDTYKSHYNLFKQLRIIRKFFIFGNKSPNKMITTFNDLSKTFADTKSHPAWDFSVGTGGYLFGPAGRPATAIILYSSGTTGPPKGAKITHLNFIATAQQPRQHIGGVPVLSIAPWNSCMGQMTSLCVLICGETFVFIAKFQEERLLSAIQKYKAGVLIVAPPVVVILSKSTILDNFKVDSVKQVISGGAPLENKTMELFKRRVPSVYLVTQGYGMTEATGIVTQETEQETKSGSVGKVVKGNIIKIVDVETNKTLGPNQPGEVRVKGSVLFDGYIKKPAELDEEGFFKTGDVAYYDEEGFFFIVDRIKELIKYKAWQVSPSEIEAVLLQHPGVKDAGVIGVKDELAGELPTAFVVKQDGVNVTEQELIDFVTPKVSPWKRIRGGVRFVNEIPKTTSGKILRQELKEMAKHTKSKL